MENPFLVLFLLFLALIYTYFLVSKLPKGIPRILALAPVFYLLYFFPWCFSFAFLRAVLSFFLTWITSFKLILFCFNRGLLSNCKNSIDFILISIFPLKINTANGKYEVEEIFKQPYLATSFQDFWGRRWNRYSSKILRLAIYDPTLETLLNSNYFFVGDENTAKILATVNTFVVSAIMHELMFYYITCGLKPSCEVMWFFVLQGFCISCERMFQARNWIIMYPRFSILLKRLFIVFSFYFLLFLPVMSQGSNRCE